MGLVNYDKYKYTDNEGNINSFNGDFISMTEWNSTTTSEETVNNENEIDKEFTSLVEKAVNLKTDLETVISNIVEELNILLPEIEKLLDSNFSKTKYSKDKGYHVLKFFTYYEESESKFCIEFFKNPRNETIFKLSVWEYLIDNNNNPVYPVYPKYLYDKDEYNFKDITWLFSYNFDLNDTKINDEYIPLLLIKRNIIEGKIKDIIKENLKHELGGNN